VLADAPTSEVAGDLSVAQRTRPQAPLVVEGAAVEPHGPPRSVATPRRGVPRQSSLSRGRHRFGIAAQTLSPNALGLELLENAAVTGLGLYVLILVFMPVSGAHFNPVSRWSTRSLATSAGETSLEVHLAHRSSAVSVAPFLQT